MTTSRPVRAPSSSSPSSASRLVTSYGLVGLHGVDSSHHGCLGRPHHCGAGDEHEPAHTGRGGKHGQCEGRVDIHQTVRLRARAWGRAALAAGRPRAPQCPHRRRCRRGLPLLRRSPSISSLQERAGAGRSATVPPRVSRRREAELSSASVRTRWRPRKPVAPVTRMRRPSSAWAGTASSPASGTGARPRPRSGRDGCACTAGWRRCGAGSPSSCTGLASPPPR